MLLVCRIGPSTTVDTTLLPLLPIKLRAVTLRCGRKLALVSLKIFVVPPHGASFSLSSGKKFTPVRQECRLGTLPLTREWPFPREYFRGWTENTDKYVDERSEIFRK